MGGGLAFKFDVNIKRRSLDQHRMILMVTFINELDPVEPLRPCQIAKEILIQVTNEELASLKPESAYRKPKRVNLFKLSKKPLPGLIFESRGGASQDLLRTAIKGLDEYKPSREMIELLRWSKFYFTNNRNMAFDKSGNENTKNALLLQI